METPGQTEENKVVGIPFLITREMRRKLIEDMNYSHQDVRTMKPEVAMEILKNNIKNPPPPRTVVKPSSVPKTVGSGSDVPYQTS